jgi:hypothetical protein
MLMCSGMKIRRHNEEHYGDLVVYMRLKVRVPPSTANEK